MVEATSKNADKRDALGYLVFYIKKDPTNNGSGPRNAANYNARFRRGRASKTAPREFAAQGGNTTASQWLVQKDAEKDSANANKEQSSAERVPVDDFSAILAILDKGPSWEVECKQEYLKYLKGELWRCDLRRAAYGVEYMCFGENVVLHEQLLLFTMYYVDAPWNFVYKYLKELLKDNDSMIWDTDVVGQCIVMCRENKKTKNLKFLKMPKLTV